MAKITYQQFLELVKDPDSEDEEILSYILVEKGEGAFDFNLRPDPSKVEMTPEDIEFESAMQIGNGIERFRRHIRFTRRRITQPHLPVLVSEGDSWFQFPLIIKEVIDALGDDYLIWSVGAAGDTAENMVHGPQAPRKTEYMRALKRQRDHVKGFLFSAAGNDIIGEDPETQTPVLYNMLRDFNGNNGDVLGHIDSDLLDQKLDFLKGAYQTVISNVRDKPEFENLPIFIHGYDYVFPYPWGDDDPRNPLYADKDQWLGKPFSDRNIMDPDLRRNILIYLINKLHDLLETIAGNSEVTRVWHIDCRNTLTEVTDWNDEIHGTTAGFKKIAAKFRPVIANAL